MKQRGEKEYLLIEISMFLETEENNFFKKSEKGIRRNSAIPAQEKHF